MNLVNWRICNVDNHGNMKYIIQNIHKANYGRILIEFQDCIIDEEVKDHYQMSSFGGENSKEHC